MSYQLGTQSMLNIKDINPVLYRMVTEAIKITRQDFGIIKGGGYRTAELQNYYYKIGTSTKDGYQNLSYHQSGNAVDLIPWNGQKFSWESSLAFEKIHSAVVEVWYKNIWCLGQHEDYKLEWGGEWKNFPDSPHYQLTVKS